MINTGREKTTASYDIRGILCLVLGETVAACAFLPVIPLLSVALGAAALVLSRLFLRQSGGTSKSAAAGAVLSEAAVAMAIFFEVASTPLPALYRILFEEAHNEKEVRLPGQVYGVND